MSKETIATIFREANSNIENFRDKLGDAIYDAINEEDNLPWEMGKYAIATFNECKTEREFAIANNMLTAICGWGIETLIDRIK